MNATDKKMVHDLPKNSYLSYIRLFPITQTEQTRTYTTLFLTLIAIIVFGLFAISPTITTIVELRKKLEDSTFANQALEKKIKALDSLQSQYSTMGSTLDRINQAIPTSPEVPDLFARMQAVAQRSGLEITDLQSQEVVLTKKSTSKEPSSFVVVISATGNYQQLMAFLTGIKQFNRILTIDNLTIDHAEGATKTLSTTIRARAYFHPEPL